MSVASHAQVALGTLLKIRHGHAFKSKFFGDTGSYVVVTPGNFHSAGGFKRKDGEETLYTVTPRQELILKRGDLILALTDLKQTAPILGASALVPESGRYLHNQRIGKVVDIDTARIDEAYLYHLFNWQHVRAQIRASATGSTVRHTAPERIYRVVAPIPALHCQRRIIGILSVYDELIANNSERIAILDQMARTLYCEWFVHYRIPGHRSVSLMNSALGRIPEGWRVGRLDSLVEINRSALRTRARPEYIHYVDIKSVSTGAIDRYRYMASAEAPGRARRLVRDGDIIWSTVRPNRRAYALIVDPPADLVVSTGFAVLTPARAPSSFVYLHAAQDGFATHLENCARGATYPAVASRDFAAAPVVVPPAQVLEQFDDRVGAMLRQCCVLRHKNLRLQQTRDFLLPRLLSGAIDVDGLDLRHMSDEGGGDGWTS